MEVPWKVCAVCAVYAVFALTVALGGRGATWLMLWVRTEDPRMKTCS